jgi:uncharacterized repeat protein (TIGR01451 family)
MAQSGSNVIYTLSVNVSGNTVSNTVILDTLPAEVSFGSLLSSPAGTSSSYNAAFSLLTLTLPSSLPPGSYTLTYSARVNDMLKGGIKPANNAQLTYLGGGPVTASASFQVIGDYTVRVGVYNEAGELIKTVLTTQLSQPLLNFNLTPSTITSLSGPNSAVSIFYGSLYVGSWDGMTQSGSLASNGNYYLKVDNIDNRGVDKSTTQQIVVSRQLYQTTVLIYNETGEVIRHLYAYSSDPTGQGMTGIQFSTALIQPGMTQPGNVPTQLTLTLSDGTTLVWDGATDSGSLVSGGQYLVEVHTFDGNSGETTFTKQVSVLGGHRNDGLGLVTAWPNVLKPSSGNMTTTFHSSSTLNPTLDVSVYTLAGELLWRQVGAAGAGTQSYDASNLASGTYIAVVRMLNASGGSMGQQTVKFWVVR